MTAREVVYKILADSSSYNKGMTEATAALDEFKQKNKDVSEILDEVLKRGVLLTTAIAAVGIACGKMAVDFNKGFSQVQTLIPDATDRVKELQQTVLDLSPAVGKTTEDLTNGLYQVISAYGDSSEAALQLEISAKAAAAGGASTSDAINLLSAVTKGYGDTSAEAQQKVSDLAFVAVKLGQTTFPELSSSVQKVTSLSKTLGVTQEEVFSVFSSSTGVIGGASEVSTKLAATYNELLKPQDTLQKAFKSLGVATGNELIQNFGGLTGALDALKSYADSAGVPVSNLFSSMEAGQLALYATGAGSEKLSNDLIAMSQAAGATEKAFSAATTGGVNAFGFELESAKLKAQAFAIKLGQELIPQVHELSTPVFKAVDGLASLDEQTIKNIVSVGKVVLVAVSAATAIVGLTKALHAAKTATLLFNAALAANPIGAVLVAVVTAGSALAEFVKKTKAAQEAQNDLNVEKTKAQRASVAESAQTINLAKEYEYLSEKEKLSAQEKERLKTISEQLKQLYPDLNGVYDENTGSLKLNREELARLNEEKIKNLQHERLQEDKLRRETQSQLYIMKRQYDELETKRQDAATAYSNGNNFAYSDAVEYKMLQEGLSIEIEKLETKAKAYNESVAAYEKALKEVVTFDPKEENKNTPEKKETPVLINTIEKTQGERLRILDESFEREKQLIAQHGGDIVAAEKAHFEKRKKLLEDFNREDLEKGITLDESNKLDLAGSAGTIEKERADTIERLSKIESEVNQKRLTETSQIAEKTEESINREIALRRELGQIEGTTQDEIERNTLIEKGNALKEKQKSLIDEYNRLMDSGKEADTQRAEILRGEIDELGKSAQKALAEAGKTSTSVWDKVVSSATEAAIKIQDIFSGLKDIFTGIISNKAETEARAYAQKLTNIEKEKNATILELDQELDSLRYEQEQADKERNEAENEEAYQKTIEEYDRNLNDLQMSFDNETNIKKLREIETKLEAERKKKEEEQQRKKEEAEKKRWEEQQRKEEVALLNQKQDREYQFAVAQVHVENEAGAAKAKAAQEQAKWEKASTILSLSLQAAMMTAKAAASYPVVPSMVAYGIAAGIAVAQAAVATSAPIPADYSPQSLPVSPAPIKFATGGIALPQSNGTPFALPSGYPAIAAEAGIPEMIMPLTAPNIETFIKATLPSLPATSSFNYAPVFHFQIPYTEHTDPQQVFDYIKEHCARDLFDTVESAKRKWYIGD